MKELYRIKEYILNSANDLVPHCRGIAIDLTLVNDNGDELDMGTKFNEFIPKSYHDSGEISFAAQKIV